MLKGWKGLHLIVEYSHVENSVLLCAVQFRNSSFQHIIYLWMYSIKILVGKWVEVTTLKKQQQQKKKTEKPIWNNNNKKGFLSTFLLSN